MRKITLVFISVLFLIFVTSINPKELFVQRILHTDLTQISNRGKLIVSMSKNATDFFLYKGKPLGFQLEVLEDLGNYLGLKVEVNVCNDPAENVEMLRSGKCDMIASSWNLSSSIDKFSVTSVPLLMTDLVLVQRKSPTKDSSWLHRDTTLIRNLKDLKGRTVYVPVLSKQADIIQQLNEATHKQIQVVEMPQYSEEQLVQLVADGNVDYTICNGIMAQFYKDHFKSLDFSTLVAREAPVTWVFRKSSPKLIQIVNQWLIHYKVSTRFALLRDKYFDQDNKWAVSLNRYEAFNEDKISRYDGLFKKYSKVIHWDWRLLASLVYQESRFNPTVTSYRGAYGLMQLMPATQSYFGIDTTATPEQQIRAGVQYIKMLNREFTSSIPDPKERINFILASYNIGPGHIIDAQRIAERYGKNPQKWFNNVDSCLLGKLNPQMFKDPSVQYGYCDGEETYNFVKDIIHRYDLYKNAIAEN